MIVEQVIKYKYKGQEFESLQVLQNYIHNRIGEEVIDKINRVCPPERYKDLFKLLEVLCSPSVRKELTELLNVTFESIDEDEESEIVNVLDIK